MPLYEYECDDGHRFDLFKHRISDRHNAVCPMCKKSANLRISLSRWRQAIPITVYQQLPNNGGYMELDRIPDSESIRPPTPPEELVRIGELSNNANRFEPSVK